MRRSGRISYRRLSGQEQNLAGYWPLNEGTGLLARDRRQPISAADGQPLPIVARDGTVAKDAWSQIDDLPLRVLAPGIEAAAVVVAELNGPDVGLEVPNQPALTITNSMTAEAWVRGRHWTQVGFLPDPLDVQRQQGLGVALWQRRMLICCRSEHDADRSCQP